MAFDIQCNSKTIVCEEHGSIGTVQIHNVDEHGFGLRADVCSKCFAREMEKFYPRYNALSERIENIDKRLTKLEKQMANFIIEMERMKRELHERRTP